jgi:hypothetical protein
VLVAILVDFRFYNYQKPSIAAATTTNYTAANVATSPKNAIVALFKYANVNIKSLVM